MGVHLASRAHQLRPDLGARLVADAFAHGDLAAPELGVDRLDIGEEGVGRERHLRQIDEMRRRGARREGPSLAASRQRGRSQEPPVAQRRRHARAVVHARIRPRRHAARPARRSLMVSRSARPLRRRPRRTRARARRQRLVDGIVDAEQPPPTHHREAARVTLHQLRLHRLERPFALLALKSYRTTRRTDPSKIASFRPTNRHRGLRPAHPRACGKVRATDRGPHPCLHPFLPGDQHAHE